MAIKFAPPWLLALGSDDGPLVDDEEVQREVAALKVRFEREDRLATGELFVDPLAPPHPRGEQPPALTELLPTGDATDIPPAEPFARPVQAVPPTTDPGAPLPGATPPGSLLPGTNVPGGGAGSLGPPRAVPELTAPVPLPIAPPEAPPPPPPADRPPGTFRFPPRRDKEDDEDAE